MGGTRTGPLPQRWRHAIPSACAAVPCCRTAYTLTPCRESTLDPEAQVAGLNSSSTMRYRTGADAVVRSHPLPEGVDVGTVIGAPAAEVASGDILVSKSGSSQPRGS